MKRVRKRLAISIGLLWTMVYLLIGIVSVCILYWIGKSHKIDIMLEYKEDIFVFSMIMLGCFLVSLVLSYAVSWAYTQDMLVIEEKRIHCRGFFYEYKELEKVSVRRFLLVWMVKINIPSTKTTAFFVDSKEEAYRLLTLWQTETKK